MPDGTHSPLWYTGLDSGSILSFGQLAREFIRHFGNFKKRKRPYSCLTVIVQGEEESFSSFIHRFDAMALSVGELPLTLRLDYLYSNTLQKRFTKELSDTSPRNKAELAALVAKHMGGDDYRRAKALRGKSKKEKPQQEKRQQEPNAQRKMENQSRRERRRSPPPRNHHTYKALSCPIEEVLGCIEGKFYEIKWSRKHRESRGTRESNSYCKFHKQRGHSTETCIDLMNEIERLLDLGHLKDFRAGRQQLSGHWGDRRE